MKLSPKTKSNFTDKLTSIHKLETILQLNQALRHWGTDSFDTTLKAELESLPADTLPLHLATTQGGIVDDSDISASILTSTETASEIRIRVSVFFTEIVPGCNCNEPPLETSAYTLLEVKIDKASAKAHFALLSE